MNGPSTRAISRSLAGGAVTGASQELFPDRGAATGDIVGGYNAVQERWINNPSAAATIWVNLFGGAAAANAADCFALPPNGSWSGKIVNQINVIGTAGQAITAGER